MGGAVGNLFDRIAYGYVVDFLEIRLFRFAIFNIADCAITIGSALLVLYLILHWHELGDAPDAKELSCDAPSIEEERPV